MDEFKKCSKCKIVKTKEEFSKRLNRKCGLNSKCKLCCSIKSDKYRKLMMENEPFLYWLRKSFEGAKYRSKKNNKEFLLTKIDIIDIFDIHCFYCKKEMKFNGGQYNKQLSPSLDKVIPNKGYNKDNVVVCCHRCNAIKNDANIEELENIIIGIRKFIKE